MPLHSHVRIYVHLVFGTHKREHHLNKNVRRQLFSHLLQRAEEIKLPVVKMNIQPEHVHILFILPSDRTMAQIAKDLKGESSRWINQNQWLPAKFYWQRGYGAFSVSQSQLNRVKYYIQNQDAHHTRKTYAQEYEAWARKYGVWED